MKSVIKKDMGVSPVIAVILMVAITVVLAGVVFLWAQSLSNTSDTADLISVDLEIKQDTTATPTTTLYVTPTKGEIDWSIHDLFVEGVVYTFTPAAMVLETGATEPIVITTTKTIGEEINVRIVNTEDDQTLVDEDLLIKAA